jgi:two-component system sensor histidine kinase DesK
MTFDPEIDAAATPAPSPAGRSAARARVRSNRMSVQNPDAPAPEIERATADPLREPAAAEAPSPGLPGSTSSDSDRFGGGRRPERSRFFGMLWSCIWLVVLLSPIGTLFHDHASTTKTTLAILATVGFAAVYVAWMWRLQSGTVYASRQPWQWPLALAAYALALILWLGGDWISVTIFVSVAFGLSLPERPAIRSVVVVSAATLALCFAYDVDAAVVGWLVFETFMLGIAMTWIRSMIILIHDLRAAREQVARLAVNEERLRFARDVHDLLGHTLSTIALKSQVARRMIRRDPGGAEQELGEVEALAQQSLQEVREAVVGYRKVSLQGELAGARSALEAAGIEATIRTSGDLPEDVGSALAWAIREGVTNVIRHSGARRCEISVTGGGPMAELEISDDGRGLPSLAGFAGNGGAGTGLRGLGERMRDAGGRLEAGKRAGGGFRLAASVPVQAP